MMPPSLAIVTGGDRAQEDLENAFLIHPWPWNDKINALSCGWDSRLPALCPHAAWECGPVPVFLPHAGPHMRACPCCRALGRL